MVSLIGGGGKTTSLFALGRQAAGHAVLTTTTKMGSERDGGFEVLLAPSDGQVEAAFKTTNEILVWTDRSERKATGVSPDDCERWFDLLTVDHVIIEADGSRQRPFKAPHVFEPVVPERTTLLVACMGADALGRVIADQCHRPLRVAAIAGCSPYQRLTPERAAAVLLSDRGSRKGLPPSARFAVLVHRVDDSNQKFVDELARHLEGRAPLIAVLPDTEVAQRSPAVDSR